MFVNLFRFAVAASAVHRRWRRKARRRLQDCKSMRLVEWAFQFHVPNSMCLSMVQLLQ